MPIFKPSLYEIRITFQRHHDYYQKIPGETRQQQIEGEKSLRLQYAGRAPFELVQNAFDRCRNHVFCGMLDSEKKILIVGNDGQSISVDDKFDYDSQADAKTSQKRSDFHALCSVHTSNKQADESIGNKGVGFKSVFSLANYVQVWSRMTDGSGWWGMELHRLMEHAFLKERMQADPSLLQGKNKLLAGNELPITDQGSWPSFYFPIPLWRDELPDPSIPDDLPLVTLIIVPLETEDARKTAAATMKELQDARFSFVGLWESKRNVSIHICHNESSGIHHTWLDAQKNKRPGEFITWWPEDNAPESDEKKHLVKLAHKAEHAVSSPGVAIVWDPCELQKNSTSHFLYTYLPTQVKGPVNADIHADFQLGIDRTTLKTNEKEPVGQYNQALLEAAAELHLISILRCLEYPDSEIQKWASWKWIKNPEHSKHDGFPAKQRDDLWDFLRPLGANNDHFLKHLESLLFINSGWHDPKRYEKWAELAERFFRERIRPLQTFDRFWEVSGEWLTRAPWPRHYKDWIRCAITMCDALRTVEARVAPLTGIKHDLLKPVSHWEPLPDRLKQGERGAKRRLFQYADSENEKINVVSRLPEPVLKKGRAITVYHFPDQFDNKDMRPTGTVLFDRWALLNELGQIPNDLSKWEEIQPLDADPEKARSLQFEILQFAAELFTVQFGTRKAPQEETEKFNHPCWRANKSEGPNTEPDIRAGRRIATLFLPTVEGKWEPARQLCRKDVDPEWLGMIQQNVPGLKTDRLLTFLGGAPSETGLIILEDGEEGQIEPRDLPPEILSTDIRKTDTSPFVPVDISFRKITGSIADAIRESWQWLGNVVKAEQEGRINANNPTIIPHLRNHPWYPVDAENGAIAPVGITNLPEYIAPENLILKHESSDRRLKALWRVSHTLKKDREILSAIGVLSGLTEEELEKDGASSAIRMIKQLAELDLEVIKKEPGARQGLLDLFQFLVDMIVRYGNPDITPFPLLVYTPSDRELSFSERRLQWCKIDETWIAFDHSQREIMRRFFHVMPIATATIGENNIKKIKWMDQRKVKINEEIRADNVQEVSTLGSDVQEKLKQLLPGLLALAEVSRSITKEIKMNDVIERWSKTQFMHVADAWIKYTIIDSAVSREAEWLRKTWDDVLMHKDKKQIVFDTPPGENRTPPLSYFGKPLAQAVLEDERIGWLWSQALAEYEHGDASEEGYLRFRKFLEKHGASGLEEAYKKYLSPLEGENEKKFRDKVIAALQTMECGLQYPNASVMELQHLYPEHLTPPEKGWGNLTDDNINQCFESVDWTEQEKLFQPRFSCITNNLKQWREWLKANRYDSRLILFAGRYLEAEEDRENLETLLDEHAKHRASSIAFDPAAVAWEWLKKMTKSDSPVNTGDDDPGRLDDVLSEMPVSGAFKPVKQKIQEAGSLGWKRRTVASPSPDGAEISPKSTQEYIAEALHKSKRGAGAEASLLEWVEEKTGDTLGKHPQVGWKALMSVFKTKGKVWRALEDARNQKEPLKHALHVSRIWGSAGYDLIGLEEENNQPLVVRYEVKGIHHKTGPICVFLSANELAVYRRVFHNGQSNVEDDPRRRGMWKLVGVDETGSAFDLTSYLNPLKDEHQGPLLDLQNQGFAPDGLVLTIDRI